MTTITVPRLNTIPVIVPVTESPPGTIGVGALMVKSEGLKVRMVVPDAKPGIVLVTMKKVQDAIVAVPVAVWPARVVSLNGTVTVPSGAVVGAPVNSKVS